MISVVYTFKTNPQKLLLKELCKDKVDQFYILTDLKNDLLNLIANLNKLNQPFKILGIAEVRKGGTRQETRAYNDFHKKVIDSLFPEFIRLNKIENLEIPSRALIGNSFCNWSIFNIYRHTKNGLNKYHFIHVSKKENIEENLGRIINAFTPF